MSTPYGYPDRHALLRRSIAQLNVLLDQVKHAETRIAELENERQDLIEHKDEVDADEHHLIALKHAVAPNPGGLHYRNVLAQLFEDWAGAKEIQSDDLNKRIEDISSEIEVYTQVSKERWEEIETGLGLEHVSHET